MSVTAVPSLKNEPNTNVYVHSSNTSQKHDTCSCDSFEPCNASNKNGRARISCHKEHPGTLRALQWPFCQTGPCQKSLQKIWATCSCCAPSSGDLCLAAGRSPLFQHSFVYSWDQRPAATSTVSRFAAPLNNFKHAQPVLVA